MQLELHFFFFLHQCGVVINYIKNKHVPQVLDTFWLYIFVHFEQYILKLIKLHFVKYVFVVYLFKIKALCFDILLYNTRAARLILKRLRSRFKHSCDRISIWQRNSAMSIKPLVFLIVQYFAQNLWKSQNLKSTETIKTRVRENIVHRSIYGARQTCQNNCSSLSTQQHQSCVFDTVPSTP